MRQLAEHRIWRFGIVIYSVAVSVGSLASAGAILFNPDLASHWMGVTFEAGALVWHQFLAVFLGCVRLSFWIGLVALGRGLGWGRLRFAWEYTTLVDLVIGTFVALQVARGVLEPGWIRVVYSDLSAAAFQAALLGLGLLPSSTGKGAVAGPIPASVPLLR
jgi:hypothetical protein